MEDKLKLLIVEDDDDSIEFFIKALENDYEIEVRTSFESAKELIDVTPPHLILSDISLRSAQTGFDLLKYVKGHYPSILVIMITAYSRREFAIDAIRGGAFDYIEKPVNIEYLWFSLKKASEYKRNEFKSEQNIREIKQYNQKLRLHYNNTPLAVIEMDNKFRILAWNPAAEKIFGYSYNEVRGKDFDFLVADSAKKEVAEVRRKLLVNQGGKHLSYENLRKDGKLIFCDWYNTPITDDQDNVIEVVSLASDITEKKNVAEERLKMQAQLAQSSKLASLGTLSAGIAHELNNPLSGIAGYSQLIQSEDDSAKHTEWARKISDLVERMSKNIKHMLKFARESTDEEKERLNINEVISDSLILLEKQLQNRNIEIRLELDEVVKPIFGCSNELESVFQNLFVNSRDAFETISEEVSKVIVVSTAVSEDTLKIIYKDNAGGMTPQTKERLFDPFYTTKEIGKGTGLGMSIVYGIISKHKGTISVNSEKGEGTKFEINLPVMTANLDSSVQTKNLRNIRESRNLEGLSQKSKVLIIDDEESICETLREFLLDDFDVDYFTDPDAGKNALRNLDYDILLVDVTMPKISGLEIIKESYSIKPDSPIILMTGHLSNHHDVVQALKFGAKGIINKPFENLSGLASMLAVYLGDKANKKAAS